MTEQVRARWGRLGRVCAVIAVAVSVGAGCGGGSGPAPTSPAVELAGLSADQVLVAARAAANDARSVHVVGNVARGGQRTALDLRLLGDGDGGGFIETTGGRIDVVRAGRDLYFRADRATLTKVLGPDRAQKAGSRFVKVPVGDATFRSFRDLLDKDTLFETLLSPSGALSRVGGTPVDAVATVGLRDDDPTSGGVLYVAATGLPYPLLLKPDDAKDGAAELHLSEWNTEIEIVRPPTNQVVAIGDLDG